MTERKTTEIKIRVTPSFKARVQGAADAAGVSLTEWLEDASREKMLPLGMTARTGWDPQRKSGLVPEADLREFISTNIGDGEAIVPIRWNTESHPAKSWMYEGKGG